MAFGIDDALMAAAAGISLTDTIVKTIQSYRGEDKQIDIEQLIAEVRVTALRRIDDADAAIMLLERTLIDKGVDVDSPLREVIRSTPWWKPFEQHKLKRIQQSFNELSTAIYGATDDIAALVRCNGTAAKMGEAVVASAAAKHELHARILNAPSLKNSISILRAELVKHKQALSS